MVKHRVENGNLKVLCDVCGEVVGIERDYPYNSSGMEGKTAEELYENRNRFASTSATITHDWVKTCISCYSQYCPKCTVTKHYRIIYADGSRSNVLDTVFCRACARSGRYKEFDGENREYVD